MGRCDNCMRMGKLRVFLATSVIISAPFVLAQADNAEHGEESPPVSSESSTAPTTTSPEAPVESPPSHPSENDVPPSALHPAPPPPPAPREPVDRPSPTPVSPGMSQGRPGRPIHPAPAPEGGSFFEPPRVERETETETSSVTATSEVTTTVVEEPTPAEPVDETEETRPPEVDGQRPTKGFSDPLGGGRRDGDPFDPKNEGVYRAKPQPLFAAGDLTGLFVIGVAILFMPFVVHDGRRFTKNNTCR